MALVPVTVTIQDATPTLVDGVLVQAFDVGGVFVTEATTGTNTAGVADFILNGDVAGITYTLRFSLNGYTFVGGAEQSVTVTDPPNPNNDFGPFTAALGPTVPLVTLRTLEADLTPIPNVLVRVYDAGDVFVAEGATDASGILRLPLSGVATPGTTYIVRALQAGVIFDLAQTIAVEDPLTPPNLNEFDIIGIVVTLPQAVNPAYCRITGCLGDLTGRGLQNRVVRILPVVCYPDPSLELSHHYVGSPSIVNGKILAAPVELRTSSTGYIDVELPRGGVYCIHLTGFENPITIVEPFEVPDAAAADLSDVLFPYPASVTYAPVSSTIDLTGGSPSASVALTVLDQTGRTVNPAKVLELLEFTSSDENIVTVSYNAALGEVILSAVAVGTVTISASRITDSFAPRIPAPAILMDPTLVVTVI